MGRGRELLQEPMRPHIASAGLERTQSQGHAGTHHVLHVFWSEGGQLQLQLAQALEAVQEVLEKGSGLIHQQYAKAIW